MERVVFMFLFEDRPAVGSPLEATETEGARAVFVAVVKMKAEPVGASFGENSGVARADEAAVGFGKEGTAALKQVFPIAVEVRAGGGRASADAYVVGAVHAAAALAPVDEEVVIVVALIEAGGLD